MLRFLRMESRLVLRTGLNGTDYHSFLNHFCRSGPGIGFQNQPISKSKPFSCFNCDARSPPLDEQEPAIPMLQRRCHVGGGCKGGQGWGVEASDNILVDFWNVGLATVELEIKGMSHCLDLDPSIQIVYFLIFNESHPLVCELEWFSKQNVGNCTRLIFKKGALSLVFSDYREGRFSFCNH